MDTSNVTSACPTCIEPTIQQESNYKEVDDCSYVSAENDTATVKIQPGGYRVEGYRKESLVGERIRKLNKMVAKWG